MTWYRIELVRNDDPVIEHVEHVDDGRTVDDWQTHWPDDTVATAQAVSELYAAASFDHVDWHFEAGDLVDPAHPMVALRPDLFTLSKTKPARRPSTPKE